MADKTKAITNNEQKGSKMTPEESKAIGMLMSYIDACEDAEDDTELLDERFAGYVDGVLVGFREKREEENADKWDAYKEIMAGHDDLSIGCRCDIYRAVLKDDLDASVIYDEYASIMALAEEHGRKVDTQRVLRDARRFWYGKMDDLVDSYRDELEAEEDAFLMESAEDAD